MDRNALLAERFEENRPRLRAVAYRMLGSPAEAEDAVQEAWLRLSRAGDGGVDNLAAWLTTVVGRVCLDMLRSRTARREDTYGEHAPEPPAGGPDPEQEALLADAVGLALLVVLETLTPTERLAFVLHDLFGVPFDEIAPIVGRSPDAARQLASRARRRVRADPAAADPETPAGREVVEAFLAASRGGEMNRLLTLLDPDVEVRIDQAAGARGADAVARFFAGRAQAARPALVDGVLGFAAITGGELRVAVRATLVDGRITALHAVTDPRLLAEMVVTLVE
ncbi:sigma-70 family RNA polymerase sigma factor [Paractinoplanes rishiriensis]|uniref:RNA polymerase sigma factor n=1 Tax=Paractinoplanes rishiriensis TaxID=1050105 RepID=A0A919K5W6_9ACTN|nr:sigma-70 family RNA polymerase sigma factor [Actinoplanes rishiriensis]GIF00200.1 RNA polymerase sigma factor [Actinoplanes rishiriensis]